MLDAVDGEHTELATAVTVDGFQGMVADADTRAKEGIVEAAEVSSPGYKVNEDDTDETSTDAEPIKSVASKMRLNVVAL